MYAGVTNVKMNGFQEVKIYLYAVENANHPIGINNKTIKFSYQLNSKFHTFNSKNILTDNNVIKLVYKMSSKNPRILVEFPSVDCTERGFETLCSSQRSFNYVGKDRYEITQIQLNALDIQGIPYKIIP